MPESEPFPLDLEPMATAVDDPPESDAASNVGERAAGDDGESHAGVGDQATEGLLRLGIEPRFGRATDDRRERPIEIEDQDQPRPRLDLSPDSFSERAEGGPTRPAAAQRSLTPRLWTGRRVRSVRMRLAQR